MTNNRMTIRQIAEADHDCPEEIGAMSEKQKNKILDVMHTLSCIRDGRATDPKISAKACWEVLADVMDMGIPK